MELMRLQTDAQQDLLDKLSRTLDLVLKTADAASADNNHQVVIQSAREVTRLAGLMHKMISSADKADRAPRRGLGDAKSDDLPALGKKPSVRLESIGREKSGAGQTDTDDMHPDDFLIPDLETVFTPLEMAYWEGLPDNIFQKFSDNYRELQTIGKEMAKDLKAKNKESGRG